MSEASKEEMLATGLVMVIGSVMVTLEAVRSAPDFKGEDIRVGTCIWLSRILVVSTMITLTNAGCGRASVSVQNAKMAPKMGK
jgi:hypothetical protein